MKIDVDRVTLGPTWAQACSEFYSRCSKEITSMKCNVQSDIYHNMFSNLDKPINKNTKFMKKGLTI
jgi:hypothetical protein